MNQSELRLGNLLWFRDKKIVEVSNLGNSFETIELVNGLRYGSDDINEYNPVKLTTKIFNDDILNIDDNNFNIWIELINNRFYLMCLSDGLSVKIKRIKYVHELQNIYNWFTQKELKLNL